MLIQRLVIETGIEPEYENALIESAKKFGLSISIVQNIPFTDEFIQGSQENPIGQELKNDEAAWFHGSIQAAKSATKVTKWQVHAPWNELKCSYYYPILLDELFNIDHTFSTLERFHKRKDKIFQKLSIVEDETLFVRPNSCDKIFTGGCISLDTFDSQYNLITFYDPSPSTCIVLARPRVIMAEARFFIVDGEVITGSYYKTGGQSVWLEANEKLMAIAKEKLEYCLENGYNPSRSWILDLAESSEGWSILEVGASSCCGLYKCDTDKIIQALIG